MQGNVCSARNWIIEYWLIVGSYGWPSLKIENWETLASPLAATERISNREFRFKRVCGVWWPSFMYAFDGKPNENRFLWPPKMNMFHNSSATVLCQCKTTMWLRFRRVLTKTRSNHWKNSMNSWNEQQRKIKFIHSQCTLSSPMWYEAAHKRPYSSSRMYWCESNAPRKLKWNSIVGDQKIATTTKKIVFVCVSSPSRINDTQRKW